MKHLRQIFVGSLLALGLAGGSVAAQAQQPAPSTDAAATPNPALKSTNDMTQAPLAAGQNSFTKGQARARIVSAGYSHVKDLKKDSEGLWQARAKQHGSYVRVALDYKGNVATH
jgi:hypothetical protein